MANELTAEQVEELRNGIAAGKTDMARAYGRYFTGRKTLYTDVEEITEDNVLDVLADIEVNQSANEVAINYLYRYYKGDQPILYRTKEVRPEICNRILVNRANEIVSFKTGYLMGEPVQYISRGADGTILQELTEELAQLNNYMVSEYKSAKDKALAEWFSITGVAYRLVLPDNTFTKGADFAPFEIYTLDPRTTGVVYNSGVGHRRMMGFTYINLQDGGRVYSIYTDKQYFEITNGKITKSDTHYLGDIPIIEYKANNAKLGEFEIVLPLLDAINTTASNRLDGVEQFVQALMMFKGVDIDDEAFANLREQGGIKVPADGDVKYLIQDLNQSQTQTLVDDMYSTVLTIVGMPNRNGGSSTSDTGAAVTMRDGWSDAEARAKMTAECFKESEGIFLKMVLKIMDKMAQVKINPYNIEPHFGGYNHENNLQRSQILTTMLNNPQIDPKLAFECCGLFVDPEMAYQQSRAYFEKVQEEELRKEQLLNESTAENTDPGEYNPHRDLSQTENPSRTTSRKGQSRGSQVRQESRT